MDKYIWLVGFKLKFYVLNGVLSLFLIVYWHVNIQAKFIIIIKITT